MAHHQKHSMEHDVQVSRSLQGRTNSNNMPAIAEDEAIGEADEPPERPKSEQQQQQSFAKTFVAPALSRRSSLLTQALTTDAESCVEDDQPPLNTLKQAASVSSTSSTYSGPSVWDFTSDDGQVSAGTRASTPGSPHSIHAYEKQNPTRRPATTSSSQAPTSAARAKTLPEKSQEGNVEATLGRKRCITFACANKAPPTLPKQESNADTQIVENTQQVTTKRPCTIKFACPFKGSGSPQAKNKFSRHLSPAPPIKVTSPTGPRKRLHRDSDTTIRNASPMPASEQTPTDSRPRRIKERSPVRGEKMKCYVFASSDGEEDDWIQESTVHRSRLTVDDTLVKENRIRRLAEEAEEEEALEDDLEDLDDLDDTPVDDDDEFVSDEGFDSDDEEGFAESDDENGSDSDYEWWVPRKAKTSSSPFVSGGHFTVRSLQRAGSGSSMDSLSISPKASRLHSNERRREKSRRKSKPVDIKVDGSDLPDSTDFVCGTLDEDKPLEEAFIANLKQSQAAKHKAVPQDIDPTFPTSDPEMGMDEEDDDDEEDFATTGFMESGTPKFSSQNGQVKSDEEFRGRRPSTQLSSPVLSPKRQRSPAAVKLVRRTTMPRSPAPSRTIKTPSPAKLSAATLRAKSPHPNVHGSPEHGVNGLNALLVEQHSFLASRNRQVTHTSSLPRSPAPIGRKVLESACGTGENTPDLRASDIEDDGEPDGTYARKAIDIRQGLEHKRLRRRQKLYSIYCQKSEKKKDKRPLPGKGADRMRQVGIGCARYRGKRMMSF